MRGLMNIPLLRLFIINGVMGIAFGLAIAVMLLAVDFRGLGTLAWRTEGGLIAVGMMSLVLGVTCASAAISTAVMLLPLRKEDDDSYGGMDGDAHIPAPVARASRRRGVHGIPDVNRRKRSR